MCHIKRNDWLWIIGHHWDLVKTISSSERVANYLRNSIWKCSWTGGKWKEAHSIIRNLSLSRTGARLVILILFPLIVYIILPMWFPNFPSGFAGSSHFEAAQIDSLAELHREYEEEIDSLMAVLFGFSDGDKEEMIKAIGEPARDKYFPILEDIAKVSWSVPDDTLYRYSLKPRITIHFNPIANRMFSPSTCLHLPFNSFFPQYQVNIL